METTLDQLDAGRYRFDQPVVEVTVGHCNEYDALGSDQVDQEARHGDVPIQERGNRAARLSYQRQADAAHLTGHDREVTVKFKKKGRYRYLCTVPGHAAAGMRGVFTVR